MERKNIPEQLGNTWDKLREVLRSGFSGGWELFNWIIDKNIVLKYEVHKKVLKYFLIIFIFFKNLLKVQSIGGSNNF